jgi:hypothetical protein
MGTDPNDSSLGSPPQSHNSSYSTTPRWGTGIQMRSTSTMRTCFLIILLTNTHVSPMSWMPAHMDLPILGMDPNDISLTHFLPRSHIMIHMEPPLIKEMDPNESNGHGACGCIDVLLLLSLAQVSPSQITTDHSTHIREPDFSIRQFFDYNFQMFFYNFN